MRKEKGGRRDLQLQNGKNKEESDVCFVFIEVKRWQLLVFARVNQVQFLSVCSKPLVTEKEEQEEKDHLYWNSPLIISKHHKDHNLLAILSFRCIIIVHKAMSQLPAIKILF